MKFTALLLSALLLATDAFVVRPTGVLRKATSLSMVADNAKVVLVTGSSRGLGKAIALEMGKAGQKVVINYVSDSSKASAEATVADIQAAGGDAVAVQADSKYELCIRNDSCYQTIPCLSLARVLPTSQLMNVDVATISFESGQY
jgi:hypothetical protein